MKDGIAQQIGTPSEIYEHPENTFVGGFIGSPPMNFIEGKVQDGKFVSGELDFQIPDHHDRVRAYEGRKVLIGIRPETILHTQDEEEGTFYKSTFDLDAVELLGADMLLYFFIDGHRMIAKIKTDYAVKNQKQVELLLNLDRVHFFDADTEKRIY